MSDTPAAQDPVHGQDQQTADLWARLAAHPEDTEICELLVRRYMGLVRSELSRAISRLPRHLDPEELEVSGLEALFLSVRNFRHEMGVSFESYARKRIWGGIIDRVRSLDGTPRTARQSSKLLASASMAFKQRTGRTPNPEELAAEVGVSAEHLTRMERQAQMANRLSLDSMAGPQNAEQSGSDLKAITSLSSPEKTPLHKMADAETHALLAKGILTLPDRERAILVLYYNEGIMFTEIAAAMSISESRVSQMHSRALERLKHFLSKPDARLTPDAADERGDAH